jgi:hypothetical protein
MGASEQEGVQSFELKATYFESDGQPPDLAAASASLTQLDAYLEAAWLLSTEDWSEALRDRGTAGSREGMPEIELVSMQMGSPLIVVLLVIGATAKYGSDLVDLGEKIATVGPRIKRKRAEDRLAAEEANAKALALQILSKGPPPPHAAGPATIEIAELPNGDGAGGSDIAARRQEELKENRRRFKLRPSDEQPKD